MRANIGLHVARRAAVRNALPRMSFLIADLDEAPVEAPASAAESVADMLDSVADSAAAVIDDATESAAAVYEAAQAVFAEEDVAAVVAAVPYVFGALVAIYILQALPKAIEAAKPALTAALGLLVFTLGFGFSVKLTQVPLLGPLLGDPVELFFKLSAVIITVGAGAVVYGKVSETVASVSQSVSDANAKLKSSLPDVKLPEIKAPAKKKPEAPAAAPAAPAPRKAPEKGPGFATKFEERVAAIKARDAAKKAKRS